MTRRSARRAKARSLAALLAVAVLPACASRLVVAPSPPDVHAVVVLPLENRTGSDLFVDAPPLPSIFRDVPATRVTVPVLLRDELQRQLVARGFRILDAPPHTGPEPRPVTGPEEAARRVAELGLEATALYGQVERWDPDDPSHITYVDVALDLFLAAPDGRVVWEAHWPASPFPAGGATSVALAYPSVARRVVADAIADLEPAPAGGGAP